MVGIPLQVFLCTAWACMFGGWSMPDTRQVLAHAGRFEGYTVCVFVQQQLRMMPA
jgi:hypothetical protein